MKLEEIEPTTTDITKNNVSYFEAGYRAGMIDMGKTISSVRRKFYRGIKFPNRMRELLRKYDEKDMDSEATHHMEDYVHKTRIAPFDSI